MSTEKTQEPVSTDISFGDTADALGDTIHDELARTWQARGIDLSKTTIRDGTIVDTTRQHAEVVGPAPTLGPTEDYSVGEVIGEGGMGAVHLAEQRTLQRKVAVKIARQDAGDVGAHAIIREARVTAAVEHPNIVPIHALAADDKGRPMLIMKRVAGSSWAEHLGRVAEDRLRDDVLAEQLQILERVAYAVHVAHLQGVVHRDLKPENVMIGGLGETYVVDWGLAACFAAPGVDGLPRTTAITGIEGTPRYMAPEMAEGTGASIDARTDVYLLGAILHEILTGEPPHQGDTMLTTLVAAFASVPPTYGPNVPSALADIARRAMARERDDRFPSALAFVQALELFRVHRPSTVLSDEAEERLRSVDDAAADEATWTTYNECRFAFALALRNWSDNAAARAGLNRVLRWMIEHELARDAPRAAASLLHELPDTDADLKRRVDNALERKKASEERLRQLERDADLSVGLDVRLRLVRVGGVLWALAWTGGGWLQRTGRVEITNEVWALVSAAMAAAMFVAASSSFSRLGYANESNLRQTKSAAMVFVTYAVIWGAGAVISLPMPQVALFHTAVGAAMWLTMTFNIDRRWFPVPIALAGAFVVTWMRPDYFAEAIGLMGTAGTAIATLLSRDQSAAKS